MKKIPSTAQYKVALHETWKRLDSDKKRTKQQRENAKLVVKSLYDAPYHEATCEDIARKMKFPDIDYSNPIDIANKVMGPMRIVGRILFQSLCIKPDVDPKPEGNTECFWAAFSSCDGEWPAHVTFRMLEPLAEAIKAIS